jgi:hypothetical protein
MPNHTPQIEAIATIIQIITQTLHSWLHPGKLVTTLAKIYTTRRIHPLRYRTLFFELP